MSPASSGGDDSPEAPRQKAGIWFGGDYNPEQWDAAVWAEDDVLMRQAGVNTVTVGVFSWALLEPEEGRFEFGWLDATMDRLHANGIRVILATPTASPPPWFTVAHPEAMPGEPGRMLRDSLGYVARGADAVLFFQWRASGYGAEMYHPALVPHAGPDTRIFTEAAELGTVLRRLGEVAGSVVTADAAVLADTGSRWALESRGLPSPHVRHLDVARAAHAALWRSGIGCDIAGPDSDLSPYRLVVVPAVYLLSDDAATALRRYTEDGGHLVVTFCSGIADQWHHIRTGGYPGALRDILGIRAQEFHPLELAATIALTAAEGASALDGARGRLWSERLRADGAEVLARYGDGVLAGLPAITRHSYGTGTAWYLSTLPDDQALGTVLREAAAASAVPPALPGAPPGVCVSRRHGDSGSWLFAFNHGAAAVTVPAAGLDLLTGREITGTLELPPAGVAVIREVPPKITPARPPARPVALRD